MEYFAELKQVFEELNAVMPVSNCTSVMQRQVQQMLVLKFLAGLKLKFEPIKSQILAGAELPSTEAYVRVLHATSKKRTESDGIPVTDKPGSSANNNWVDQFGARRGSHGRRSRGGHGSRGGRGTRECSYGGLKNILMKLVGI